MGGAAAQGMEGNPSAAAAGTTGGGRHYSSSSDDDEKGGGAPGSDDEWRARLREELSDDDAGGIGWARYAPRPEDELPTQPPARKSSLPRHTDEDEDDDVWAEQIWRDMEEHKRQMRKQRVPQRGLGFGDGAGGVREEGASKRVKRAAEAKAESDRILREEQAKDADWREAMLRQVQEAALPVKYEAYEAQWAAIDKRPTSQPITFSDIPWPGGATKQQQLQPRQAAGIGPAKPAAAAGATAGASEAELVIDAEKLKSLLLHGCKGPGDVKRRLRGELMRWHPDKFGARYGNRVSLGDRERVTAGVRAVAQQLTALMGSSST